MTTIWKFPLAVSQTQGIAMQAILMPFGAQVLAVQCQGGEPCLWALVDEQAPKMLRTFETFGTGHSIPDGNKNYVGTYQMMGLVFHVFEAAT